MMIIMVLLKNFIQLIFADITKRNLNKLYYFNNKDLKNKMIQQQTILKVSDNSGAKTVKCIKVLGGFKKKYALLGDIIIVSVQKLRNKLKKTSRFLPLKEQLGGS